VSDTIDYLTAGVITLPAKSEAAQEHISQILGAAQAFGVNIPEVWMFGAGQIFKGSTHETEKIVRSCEDKVFDLRQPVSVNANLHSKVTLTGMTADVELECTPKRHLQQRQLALAQLQSLRTHLPNPQPAVPDNFFRFVS